MSGRAQHYIPRLFLRGFLTEARGKTQKSCVYRKGETPFISSIDDIAEERDFNSPPSPDGSETLDDRFTDYENDRLTQLVQGLRATATDNIIESEVASEIIAHLAPRTSHLRSVFRKGMAGIIQTANEAFTDSDNVARLIGIDSPASIETFRAKVIELLYEEPTMATVPMPRPLVEQLAFWFVRENFSSLFANSTPFFGNVFTELLAKVKILAENGHVKAMAQDLVPPVRAQDLGGYSWTVVAAPLEGAILPDCVAISYDEDGEPFPYMLASKDDMAMVVMPISTAKVLVGRKLNAPSLNIGRLNTHFAECSHEFFVSATQAPEIAAQFPHLGKRALTVIEDALSSVAEDYLPKHKDKTALDDSEADQSLTDGQTQPITPNFSYGVRLRDFGDSEVTKKVAEILNRLVNLIGRELPLSRLDGFTFAEDYPAALRELDRGFDARPLETTSWEAGGSYAQAPLVFRDGVIKNHVICSAGFAANLLNQNDVEATRWTVNVIVRLLAATAITEIVDKTLPDVLLKPLSVPYDSTINHGLGSSSENYFTAYCAAGYGDNDAIEAFYRSCFINALERARTTILAARTTFHGDGNYNQVLKIAFGCVSEILSTAATLHGHCDGLDRSPFDQSSELDEKLCSAGIRNWFDIFRQDLETHWLRAWRWESYEEFLNFNRHVERLLMQHGIFAWPDEHGEARFLIAPESFPMESQFLGAETIRKSVGLT